jgi:apolipoprotein N-acyltransferase
MPSFSSLAEQAFFSSRLRYATAFLSGAMAVLAFAPAGLWGFMFVSLALLTRLWASDNPRQMFMDGWWYGLGLFGTGVSWVYISMADYGDMPAALAGLATFLFCAFLAMFPAVAGWLSAKLSSAGPARLLLVIPSCWTLMEWIRGWIFTGFPWLSIGYAQVPTGWLVGFAPVFGVYGLSWLSLFVAGAAVWLAQRAWMPRLWAAPLALLVGVLGIGEGLRYVDWTQPFGQPLTVALLQGNIPQELKWRPERAVQTLTEYAERIESTRAKLIVLPETAFPVFYSQLPPSYLDGIRQTARERGADILAGVPTGDIHSTYFNSAASIGGSATQFYHKQHLVAFGEFIPKGFAWIVNVLHIPLSDFVKGSKDQPPLEIAGQRVAANICYEDVFGHEIIRALPEATLLVNLTNDAWFGDSLAAWQHAQMSQMRAIETGRYMLRATNTGITAVIDQKGRVLSSLPEFAAGTLEAEVQGYAGMTPYARWGNLPVLLWLGAVLIVAWFRRQR